MSLRGLLFTLPVLSVLGALLVPGDAAACSPPLDFTIERTYPGDAGIEVPVDGVIVVIAESFIDVTANIEVRVGDVPVAGVLTQVAGNRYVWRSDLPLLPDTQYAVHFEGVSGDQPDFPLDERDFTFTTGASAAPALDPAVASSFAEGWDKEIQECVAEADPGSCDDCGEWKVVDIEKRMRLVADVAAPKGPFSGFYASRVAIGATADTLVPDGTQLQFQAGDAMNHIIDLGPAGSWEGNEVCVRAEVEDPLGQIAAGEVTCIDVSAINVTPIDETTGGTETVGDDSGGVDDSGGAEGSGGFEESDSKGSDSGDQPTGSAGDESGSGDEGGSNDGSDSAPGDDGKDAGCGCRSSESPGWSGALLLLGLGLLRPRRRR